MIYGLRSTLRALVRAKGILALVLVLGAFCGLAVFASALPLADPNARGLQDSLIAPAWPGAEGDRHPFGTDQQGRDILSRVIYGGRTSLLVALLATALSLGVGLAAGLISGYFRGADGIVMRIADIQLAFPSIMLALALAAALRGSSLLVIVVILAVTGWVEYARVVRGNVLFLRETAFVEAARTLGASDTRILAVHVLPNVITVVSALATVQVARFMIVEAGLSYLGLGVPPSVPSWGGMLQEGQQLLYVAWWPAFFPGVAISLVVLAITLVGDWLTNLWVNSGGTRRNMLM